jgi:hypothetical protein
VTSDEAVLREVPSLDLNTTTISSNNYKGNSSSKTNDGVSSNSKYGIDDPLVSSSSSSIAAISSPTSTEKGGKGKETSDDGQVIYWSVDDAELAKDLVCSKPVDADQMVWFEMDVTILGR